MPKHIAKTQVASLDVDAQNCFTPVCPDELPVPGGTEIVLELNLQARYARYRLGSKDSHSPKAMWVADDTHPQLSPVEGRNVDVRWKLHAVPGTLGFDLLDGLPAPVDYDFFVWKGVEPDMHPYGACYHDLAERLSTGVIEFLRTRGVTTVIVGGLPTDYCVKNTVLQLRRAGLAVILNSGASRGLDPRTEAEALETMRRAGVSTIQSAHELEGLVK